jgi:hypothetical protein
MGAGWGGSMNRGIGRAPSGRPSPVWWYLAPCVFMAFAVLEPAPLPPPDQGQKKAPPVRAPEGQILINDQSPRGA